MSRVRIAAAALVLFLFFFRLGDRPLRNPDEGRYAEIAREMVVSGDWIRPAVFSIPYNKKPPLHYWFTAASLKSFGFNEWAARLAPALFGVLGVLAVFLFARRFFGRETAFYAALILGTSPFYVHLGRHVIIDMVFTFFLTGSLFLFFVGTSEKKRIYSVLSFASLALAFLAKGPACVAIAGVSVLVYGLATRRLWSVLRGMRWGWGLTVFIAVAAPWFWAMARMEPDFLRVFFLHENVARVLSSTFEHQEPWFYFLWVLPVVFLPWPLCLGPLKTFRRALDEEGAAQTGTTRPLLFLCISAAVTVVFYSLSKAKVATYILPAFPLLAIVFAEGWRRWDFPSKKRLFSGIVLGVASVSLAMVFVLERANERYTTRPFAETLKPLLRPADEIYVYDHPGPFYDFEFYLDHEVRPVGLEGELENSRQDPRARQASVTREDFFGKVLSAGPKRIFCLMRKSDFSELDPKIREHLRILKEDRRKVLVEAA